MQTAIIDLLQDIRDDHITATKNPAKPHKTRTKKDPGQPFNTIILDAARKYDVDPAIIKAIIMAESGYNPKAGIPSKPHNPQAVMTKKI